MPVGLVSALAYPMARSSSSGVDTMGDGEVLPAATAADVCSTDGGEGLATAADYDNEAALLRHGPPPGYADPIPRVKKRRKQQGLKRRPRALWAMCASRLWHLQQQWWLWLLQRLWWLWCSEQLLQSRRLLQPWGAQQLWQQSQPRLSWQIPWLQRRLQRRRRRCAWAQRAVPVAISPCYGGGSCTAFPSDSCLPLRAALRAYGTRQMRYSPCGAVTAVRPCSIMARAGR